MIRAGVAALRQLPAGSWMQLRYEDLLRDPEASLTRLAAFVGVGAPRPWLDRASRLIDPARQAGTAAAELDPDTFAALRAACEPGTRALDLTMSAATAAGTQPGETP
jgi:hypothetical protein